MRASTDCSTRPAVSPSSAGATPRTSTAARSTKATTGWEALHESAGPPQGRIPQCAHEGIPVSTQPGDSVASVLTPALVIDLDAMERNLARLAEFARLRGLRLRPHAKMHKSAHIAKLQMVAGAVGVCVQKLSEAEALAAAGVSDI